MLYLHPLSASLTTDLVAQLVEHLPFKERVLGSSPSRVTIKRKILTKLVRIFVFRALPS